MEEKLIEAIRNHPCIYDKSSSLFRNKYLKDRAWQEVASSTGVSEDHCKSRWKSLRDRFVREVQANKLKSGAAAQEKTEWCYMESMRFLTKHISPRKTTSNFEWSDDHSCSQAPSTSESTSEDATENLDVSGSSDSRTTKRQRLCNESRERFDRLCGTIKSFIAAKAEKPTSSNSAFLQMLDESLQKKPKEVQDRLKIEILAHVHNAI